MEFADIATSARSIRDLLEEHERERFGRAWSREELTLGLVGDIGDLAKLVQAVEGVREIEGVHEKLAHELADVMWSIIVLADQFQIDLEVAFMRTMEMIEEALTQ